MGINLANKKVIKRVPLNTQNVPSVPFKESVWETLT